MMKRSEIILMVLQVPLDFVLLLLAGLTAYSVRFSSFVVAYRPVVFHLRLSGYLNLVLYISVAWLLLFALNGLYTIDQNRKLMQDLRHVLIACAAGLSVVALYLLFSQQVFDSRFLVVVSWLFALVYICLGRIAMRGLKGLMYRAGYGARRVAIVGNSSIAAEIGRTIFARPELGYTVVEHIEHFTENTMRALVEKKIDEIIFTNPRADKAETLRAIEFCNEWHVVFKYSADLFDTYSTNMTVNPFAGVPIVELKRTPLEGWGRVAKRLFDIGMSLFMIVLTSPIMLVTALVIFFETGRPFIYQNERVGIRGKKITVYKFRSMYQKDSTGAQFGPAGDIALKKEAELIAASNTRVGPIYKIGNDPRVTPFGKFIRRWSIDELPQFFNTLFGSMSIVGPRPHQVREVEKYEKSHRVALILKPGITGLAQISGRSDLSYEQELTLDVYYIEHWKVWLDFVIFLKTPFILFRKRSVE